MTILSADGVSVVSTDGARLVDDVSLGVDAGETVLLCGAPGSGKTLLAKALRGLLADRDDLTVSGTIHRPEKLGYVFQTPGTQLVRRIVKRDVAFGLENQGVAPATIEDRIAEYADLLEASSLLDRTIRELSGGETAIVALLGILVTEPDVVILDEPLARLDRRNAEFVLQAIGRLRQHETAVVIAEHDLRDLLSWDAHVVLLDDGAVIRSGSPIEVVDALNECGVKLPFTTELALELAGREAETPIPLSIDGRDGDAW